MDAATRVDSAISKASRLMSEGYMEHLDNIAASINGTGRRGRRGGGANDLAFLEQQAFGGGYNSTPSYQQQQMPIMQEVQQARQFSNSALQESFAKNPPISGSNFPGAEAMGVPSSYQPGASLLNNGYQPGASLMTEQRMAQPYVQQPQYVQPVQQYPQAGGVDYNFIKQLVSEAIKENMEVIKQSLLKENTLRGIQMPGGNKIQFLDSKGNLYEGQLVMKKKGNK